MTIKAIETAARRFCKNDGYNIFEDTSMLFDERVELTDFSDWTELNA